MKTGVKHIRELKKTAIQIGHIQMVYGQIIKRMKQIVQ